MISADGMYPANIYHVTREAEVDPGDVWRDRCGDRHVSGKLSKECVSRGSRHRAGFPNAEKSSVLTPYTGPGSGR